MYTREKQKERLYHEQICLTPEQIEELKHNLHVLNVSEKSITYTDAFKRAFIEEYLKGQKTPRTIFQEAGFDVEALRQRRYEQAAARWLKRYNQEASLVCVMHAKIPSPR